MINAPVELVKRLICTKLNMKDECHTFVIIKGWKIHFFLSSKNRYSARHAGHALSAYSHLPTPGPPAATHEPRLPPLTRGPEWKLFLSPARAQRCHPNFIPLHSGTAYKYTRQHTCPEHPPPPPPPPGHGPSEPPRRPAGQPWASEPTSTVRTGGTIIHITMVVTPG